MAKIVSISMVIGTLNQVKPLNPKPDGRIRFRFRHDDMAIAYVKTDYSISEHFIRDKGKTWELFPPNKTNWNADKYNQNTEKP